MMLRTERLILRGWREEDREPFHRLNTHPEVRRHLGIEGTRSESDAGVDRQMAMQAERGHCFWALERAADGALIGFCGVRPGVAVTPIEEDLEIGWRLKYEEWGRGYAREAATACIDWAFATLRVPRIVSITVAANTRSWGLMERLGMVRRRDMDFDHPALPPEHRLRPHMTYVKDAP